jgi:hypothetical protein
MNLVKLLFLITVSFIIITGCKGDGKVSKVHRAAYIWEESSLSDIKSNLAELEINKLYLKYFEVDYNESMGNFPYNKQKPSPYQLQELTEKLKIIPCIFIRNEIFQYNDEKKLNELAEDIVFLIDKYNKEAENTKNLSDEIQIDCDWTLSTKEKYFYLLKQIKSKSKKTISCTLRLYPYKYSDKMGVPPVDKVSLMCYNLISPLKADSKNSILDIDEFKKYFDKKIDYPLHIDIALPIYNWSLIYQNGLFSSSSKINSSQIKSFAKESKPMWFDIKRDSSFGYNSYLRKGDRVKCEEVSVETLNNAIDIINKNVYLESEITVSLYDINSYTFTKYSNENFNQFYTQFLSK